jgi:hypothetical protein
MNYKLAEVFPPRKIEILLSPKQQESLELISSHMYEMGIDDSMALEEALDMGLSHYLEHFKRRDYELVH